MPLVEVPLRPVPMALFAPIVGAAEEEHRLSGTASLAALTSPLATATVGEAGVPPITIEASAALTLFTGPGGPGGPCGPAGPCGP